MSELIHQYPTAIEDRGTKYTARVCGTQRADGTWEGWIEFDAIGASKPRLRTGQETSQPTRDTLEYWALGLEPIYFEGALARAQGRLLKAAV
jgi:hypothetical protein